MSPFVSTISGQFSKALILAALLPATVFVVLWLLFVAPLLPPEVLPVQPIEALASEWQLLTISVTTIVLAGLLYNLSGAIIRLYEGYPWLRSILGRKLVERKKAQLRDAKARIDGLHALLKKIGQDHAEYKRVLDAWNQTKYTTRREFPNDSSAVLPTRLGNVIRSFERYPDEEYGIEAIEIWPRLIGVIEPTYLSAVEDAKTSFDFMINSSFLSLLLTLIVLVLGLSFPPPQILPRVFFPAVIFGMLAIGFYSLSIRQAFKWGALVKGAFDLYRWSLLETLGYDQRPTTREAERKLWDGISLQMMYGDRQVAPNKRVPRHPYKDADPMYPLIEADGDADLQVVRGIRLSGLLWKRRAVVIRLRNADNSGRTARAIVITDKLPDGNSYAWSSARVQGRDVCGVRVVGTNPCTFYLNGTIEAGSEVELIYETIRE